MGKYNVSIQGTGNHTKAIEGSVQKIVAKAVEELNAKGHTLETATVSSDDGDDNLLETLTATPSGDVPPGPTPPETR